MRAGDFHKTRSGGIVRIAQGKTRQQGALVCVCVPSVVRVAHSGFPLRDWALTYSEPEWVHATEVTDRIPAGPQLREVLDAYLYEADALADAACV